MLVSIPVYSMTGKEENIKLSSARLINMLPANCPKNLCELIVCHAVFLWVFVQDLDNVWFQLVEVQKLAHLYSPLLVLYNRRDVWIELPDLVGFWVGNPYSWVILLGKNEGSLHVWCKSSVSNLILKRTALHILFPILN